MPCDTVGTAVQLKTCEIETRNGERAPGENYTDSCSDCRGGGAYLLQALPAVVLFECMDTAVYISAIGYGVL